MISDTFWVILRDVHETFWAETETRSETHVSKIENKTRPRRLKFCPTQDRDKTFKIRDETETRRCSFWDAGRDLEAPETFENLGSFNVSPRRFAWRTVKDIDNEKNYTE